MKLFSVTKVGVRVIIARNELKPVPFADAHLFVHKAMPAPAPAAAAPAAPEATRTAQAGDDNKKTDAVALPKSETPAAAAPAAPEPAKAVLVSDDANTTYAAETPKPETAATAAPAATDTAAQAGDEQPKLQPLATAEAKAAAPASQQDGLAKIVAAPPAPPSRPPRPISCAAPRPRRQSRSKIRRRPRRLRRPSRPRLSKPDTPRPKGRFRSSSAARKRRSTCGRISARCSTRR